MMMSRYYKIHDSDVISVCGVAWQEGRGGGVVSLHGSAGRGGRGEDLSAWIG